MENIILHVTYTCKPGAAESFVRAIKEAGLQQQVQAEDGCIQYDYHLSFETPDTVVLLEQWRDKAALNAHAAGTAIQQLRALSPEYVLNTNLQRFE